jgi:hypothetical protein
MSKITQTPSAQSCADKMAYSSLVSQIKRYLPMKMKMGPFFRMAGILFLLSLQLVACSVFGPPPAVTSATATTTTTPGATPSVVATTTPGATPSVVATTTPGATPPVVTTPVTTPGATPPVVTTPGATPPVLPVTTPGPTPPVVVPTANPSLAFAPGSFTFDGKRIGSSNSSLMSMPIQQILLMSNGSIDVSMPDGNTLSMIVNSQTDLSAFDDKLPDVGTFLRVKAIANRDGSFTAAKLSPEQSDAPNRDVITYQGVTTSAVGTDHVIHFKVGRKSYTFTIPSSADLKDFNNNPQAIQINQAVKVEVRFHESKGTVIKVGKASD